MTESIPVTHDECLACRAFFERETGDIWRDVLQPALWKVPSLVTERLVRLERATPSDQLGLLFAVGARALFALGHGAEARSVLARGLETGDREARSLAAVAGPDGRVFVDELMEEGSSGQRADAACDGVLASLRAGDREAADRYLAAALRRCPDHAEAEHWAAYLRDAGIQAAPLLWSFDTEDDEALDTLFRGGRTDPLLGDLVALLPRASQGQLSQVRTRDRYGDFRPARPAPSGSGLERLRETGRCGRWLASDERYAELGADDPLVAAEVGFDRVRRALFGQRSPLEAAEGIEARVGELSPADRVRAVTLLTLCALREGSLEAPADRTTERGLLEQPPTPDLAAAPAAGRVLKGRVARGLPLARSALRSKALGEVGLILAIEALRRGGAQRGARRALQARVADPSVGWLAESWLEDLERPPLAMDDLWDFEDPWAYAAEA